jgi:hypothetical protein
MAWAKVIYERSWIYPVTTHLRSASIVDELIGEPDPLCSWIREVSRTVAILVPQKTEDKPARCEMVGR